MRGSLTERYAGSPRTLYCSVLVMLSCGQDSEAGTGTVKMQILASRTCVCVCVCVGGSGGGKQ